MSARTAILALVIYLVLYHLPLNPVRFRWGLRRGLAPMPSEIEQKAKELDWFGNVSIQLTLLLTVMLLMWSTSASLRSIGLSTNNWRSAVTLGAIFSVIPVALSAWVRQIPSAGKDGDSYPHIVLPNKYGLAVLTAFSSEFWRAFCITALIHSDLPPWSAVVITSVVCAVPYWYESNWTAAGAAFGGLVPGFLFVETGSLLAPLTLGLISSTYVVYDAERKGFRTATETPILICPACSHAVPRSQTPGARWIVCPGCGEQLMLLVPLWVVYVGGLVGASLTLMYLLHTYNLELVLAALLFFPAFFIFAFLSSIVLAAFFPGLAKLELAPVERSLFRF